MKKIVVNFTRHNVLEPIVLKNLRKWVNTHNSFFIFNIFISVLKLKKIFKKNISVITWWKNFLCLDGAFKKLILLIFFLKKLKLTLQFLKKNLLKSKYTNIFFKKIFFSWCFLKIFFTLKWLLYTVFIIKIYLQ